VIETTGFEREVSCECRLGELESWRVGELESWRVGELELWRVGELELWEKGVVGFLGPGDLSGA